MKMDVERMTKRIYLWSHSLAGDNFRNWAWKTQNLLDTIKDFGGLLSIDELWDALAQLEWEKAVAAIPANSESGGRFRYYRQLKGIHPELSLYKEKKNNYTITQWMSPA